MGQGKAHLVRWANRAERVGCKSHSLAPDGVAEWLWICASDVRGLLLAENDIYQFHDIRDSQFSIPIHVALRDILLCHFFCSEYEIY